MWSAKMKRMKGRNEPPPLILELLSALPTLDVAMKPKLLAPKSSRQWKDLTVEERRERRRLRREKQREDNLGRAKKMHVARLKMNKEGLDRPPEQRQFCMSVVPAGAIGDGEIPFMPGCPSRTGSSII